MVNLRRENCSRRNAIYMTLKDMITKHRLS